MCIRDRHIGDKVIGATTSKSGYFKMQAAKVGDDTTLAQIVRLVDEATSSKAPIAKMADKVSGVFVPVVISIALIAVIVWLLLGYGFEFALSIGISVLDVYKRQGLHRPEGGAGKTEQDFGGSARCTYGGKFAAGSPDCRPER